MLDRQTESDPDQLERQHEKIQRSQNPDLDSRKEAHRNRMQANQQTRQERKEN